MFSELKKAFVKTPDERVFEYIMFLCLCLFVISLPTSRAFVSIAQILLAANWLLEGSYTEKFRHLKKNRTAMYLIGVYFVYALGLLWTQDLAYGLSVLKNKLPYLSLMLVVASSPPIRFDRTITLPLLFVAALLVSTFLGMIGLLSGMFVDFRDGSLFIPHVSLSMMILMAAFYLPWHTRWLSLGNKWFLVSVAISAWLIAFMFIVGTLTGIVSLFVVVIFLLIRYLVRKPGLYRIGLFSLTIISIVAFSAFVFNKVNEPLNRIIDIDPLSLNELTAKGNKYEHKTDNKIRENGHLVFFFIAEDELRNAWHERSGIGFDSLDQAGNQLKHTLYRFLSSKGLRKDKAALDVLSDKEIKAVEQGIPNYLYMGWSNVYVRIHQTFWELYIYKQTGDPHGHSFTQRLEIWKAAIAAVKMRPLFGWGTGGHKKAIETGLVHIESKLNAFELRHTHNQFLHTMLTVGIMGLLLIFGLFFLFIKKSGVTKYLPFNIFLLLVAVFMISDSPLDSQMTLSLFLFFALYFGVFIQKQTVT